MLRRGVKRVLKDASLASEEKIDVYHHGKSNRKAIGSKDDVEEELEKLVFGGEEEMVEVLGKRKGNNISENENKDQDKKPAWEDEDEKDDFKVKVKQNKSAVKRQQKTLSGQKYSQQLRNEFVKMSGTPAWARLKSEKTDDDGGDSDDDLLQQTGNYLESSESLPPTVLDFRKCSDVNKESVTNGKLKSVEFHPSAQVILTAGMDHRLNLFQVDGKHNPKIQSIFVENYPIFSAHFNRGGDEVVMGSRHKSFYYYDMIAGKVVNVPRIKGLEESCLQKFEVSPDGRYLVFYGSYGNMHILSAKTKEWITSLKMNGSVESMAFSHDGSKLFSHGDDGEVYVWDMNSRDCIHRFIDDGCLKGTSIATSPDDQYVVCGSYSGVVNIYDSTCLTARIPKPVKSMMNLTTPCTTAKFSSNSELLALSSDYTEKALKMVHFPSMTVFSNFPDKTDNVRIPTCLDFSANSGYVTVGNNKGQALLYRLKHYSNY